MMILISGPAIACLCLHTRKWAHEHLQRGSFGPVTRGPNGVLYAELRWVEAHAGITFGEAQIAHAINGYPDRRIVLPDREEEAA
jgi:hypothetical protein